MQSTQDGRQLSVKKLTPSSVLEIEMIGANGKSSILIVGREHVEALAFMLQQALKE